MIFKSSIVICTTYILGVVLSVNVDGQISPEIDKVLTQKAITFFCENISIIDKDLSEQKIKFDRYSNGMASKVYDIAYCTGDIDLIRNEIPNKLELDSIEIHYSNKQCYQNISVEFCKSLLKKRIFAPFNKKIYKLYLYNPIEYNSFYFVEIYLINKRLNSEIIVIKFNKDLNVIDNCKKSIIY